MTGLAAGQPCPKCGHVRTAADTNPGWQCPKCLIAYAKFRPGAVPLAARIAGGGREIALEAKVDGSAYSLVAVNLLTLAIASATGMTIRDLVVVYWVQSLVIGISFSIRILCLPLGRVTHTLLDGSERPISPGDKYGAAFGVLFAFIALHLFYAFFIFFPTGGGGSRTGLLLCALAFVLNHGYSLIRNIKLDQRDNLRLGTLASLPFFRIIPMHIFAGVGVGMTPGIASFLGLLLFTVLKTGADVVMHVIEHHELRQGSSLRWLRDAHFEREMWMQQLREQEHNRGGP